MPPRPPRLKVPKPRFSVPDSKPKPRGSLPIYPEVKSPRFQPITEELPKKRTANPKALMITTAAVFSFTAYGTYLYVTYKNAVEESKKLDVPADVSDRYNKTASSFDAEVDTAEWLMGLGKKRKELVEQARGDVLEVSCGTGRNMEYYKLGEKRGMDKQGKGEIQGCRSITFVDLSGEMVKIARSKFEEKYPAFKRVAFRAQDVTDPIPPPPGARKVPASPSEPYRFDTIVQTMGLCSYADPVESLAHLGTLLEPERGQILLLEHGRSNYGFLNTLLDNLAAEHANKHGCWWNRDIEAIVRQSGLEVVESKRWHLGTTYRIVLRPGNRKPEKGGERVMSKIKEGERKGVKEENVEKDEGREREPVIEKNETWGPWLQWVPPKK